MKSRIVLLSCAVGLATAAISAAAEKGAGVDAWTADFRRFAAQENLEVDDGYSRPAASKQQMWLGDLLRRLPEPSDWPQWRQALDDAAAQASAMEKPRLQAGGWLLAYLLGERATLEAQVAAARQQAAEDDPARYILEQLRDSLREGKPGSLPGENRLEDFEEQLAAAPPLDIAAGARAREGEENLARLHRLIEAARGMQKMAAEVFEHYQRTQDEAAAEAKLNEIRKGFAEKTAADQEALAPYLEKPIVGRYIASQYEGAAERESEPSDVLVPDLVSMVGRERAEDLLRQALKLPVNLTLDKESGAATAKLTRAIALLEIERARHPAWDLAHSTDAGALFEAIRKRFPNAETDGSDYQRASGYYLAGLIQQGKSKEAVEFAAQSGAAELNLPYDGLEALERGARAGELWEFLRHWLVRFPAADEWDRFNRLSAQLGRQDEFKAIIHRMVREGGFAGLDAISVQQRQAEAELATDDLPAASARLRALVKSPATTEEEQSEQLRIAHRLLALADLQGDTAGFTWALAAAEAVLEKIRAEKPADALQRTAELTEKLNELGRHAESAGVGRAALQQLAALLKPDAAKKADDAERFVVNSVPRQLLAEQLRATIELGRWSEAAALVQESPWWGARDVADLLEENVQSDRRPLGYYMARVAQQNQPALARRILEAQLVASPAADAVYESYLALAGQEAWVLLAKLAAVDRYQERPLIWLARLQSDAGEWDAAIATLQQAISIDPSDGEQGRGDRMRVYAFLSRALAAKGETDKAAFYDGVVKAIRAAETADRWFEIGAYARALRLYREALGFFQDAYCVQSRLAVRLAHEGRMDEAAEHYRRAFELMPDSFGRVESHCFGCEHVFSGEKSQGVAEQVFARMLQARPDKPQLHYLLGYLRQEQERNAEAAEHYRKAVALDPLYLNAWDRLAGLEDELNFTAAEKDDLLCKLVELDPTRRHASPDLAGVTDFARLWRVMQEANRVVAELPASDALWELRASARENERAEDRPSFFARGARRTNDAAGVLLHHGFVQTLQTYLASLAPQSAPP